jgi:adenosine deaminase
MSRTSLTRELELLVDAFGYGLGDLEQFQMNAAAAAFQDFEAREELMEMIAEGFEQAHKNRR